MACQGIFLDEGGMAGTVPIACHAPIPTPILEGYDTYSFSNRYPEQSDTYSFFEQVSRTTGYVFFFGTGIQNIWIRVLFKQVSRISIRVQKWMWIRNFQAISSASC